MMMNCRFRNGFTLIEMMVTMVIIIVLAGLVLGSMGFVQDRQNRELAKTQIALLSNAIEDYKLDNGAYPGMQDDTPADGLVTQDLYQALFLDGLQNQSTIYLKQLDPRGNKQGWVTWNGGDSDNDSAVLSAGNLVITDPWGNPYRYRKGANAQNPDFDLWSSGKDGQTNSGADAASLNSSVNQDDIRNF